MSRCNGRSARCAGEVCAGGGGYGTEEGLCKNQRGLVGRTDSHDLKGADGARGV